VARTTQDIGYSAVLPTGLDPGITTRNTDRQALSLRGQQVLSKTHTLRIEFQWTNGRTIPFGVGGIVLGNYGRDQRSGQSLLRVTESGSLFGGANGTLRLQVRRNRRRATPMVDAPTTVVAGAFVSGGATESGQYDATRIEASGDFDIPAGGVTIQTGGSFAAERSTSNLLNNRNGTYSYSDLAAFEAEQPTLFSWTVGDSRLSVRRREWAAYVQAATILDRGRLSLSGGLRLEGQTGTGGFSMNPSPRALVAWSLPFDLQTTLKVGVGAFRSWVDLATLERAQRLDGTHETSFFATCTETVCDDPATPAATISVVRLGHNLALPSGTRTSVSADRHLVDGHLHIRGSLTLTWLRGLLTNTSVNAPDARGIRPEPRRGNVGLVESIGEGREYEAHLNVTYTPTRQFRVGASYWWRRHDVNTAGAFVFSPGPVASAYGPAADDVRHRILVTSLAELPRGFEVHLVVDASSGAPYDITTGKDENDDGILNDRPTGIGRNAGRGRPIVNIDSRIVWRLKSKQLSQKQGGVTVASDPDSDSRRSKMSVFLSLSNLPNRFNGQNYVGVISSPIYATPSGALAGRRISVGATLSF